MRQIKFRCFRDGQVIQLDQMNTSRHENHDFQKSEDRGILMQFTGLLDKNGKEIYEGDIVKCHTNNAFKYPHKGEVIYLEHIAGFGITTEPIVNDVGDEAPAFTYFNYNENFEVIGNIYKNPDLLK